MTHLYIELNTGLTEEVSSSIISKLYELAISGDLDETSVLKGRLHTDVTYLDYIDYLTDRTKPLTELLYITASDIMIRFADAEVLNVLLANNIGSNGGITLSQANLVTSFPVNMFQSNTTITTFNELSKFVNLHTLPAGCFAYCTNLTSIDLSNIKTFNGQCLRETGITSINISDSVTSIPTSCFNQCTSLTTITGGTGITDVGAYAFWRDSNLTSFPLNSLTTVLDSAFELCSSLSIPLNLPNVTHIGQCAFKNSGVTSVTLSGLTSIDGNYENGAFRGCTGLTSVDLSGSTITSLYGTFKDCTNLSSVTLPDTLTSLESYTFSECSSLQTIDLKNVTYLKEYEFRNSGLTSIDLSNIQHIGGGGVFYGCTNLTTVTFPSTPFDWFDNYNTSFENKRSFLRQCTSLTSVDLSNALSLCISMFYNDTSLTTVTLSASNITTIPEEFCWGCTNLSSLGEKIKPTTIGNDAFTDCTNLNINNYIDLSEVTYLGKQALKKTNITGVVTLPECVEFGENPLHQCSGITELHCPKLTTVNYYTSFEFRNNNSTSIEVIDIPLLSGRMPICDRLTNLRTVYAPNITYLQNNSFNGCTSLTSLNLDFTHITNIGAWAFANCTGLNNQVFDFGSSVEFIGAGAFLDTSISFVLRNSEVVTILDYGNDPLSQGWTGYVYVSDNLVNDYKSAYGWNLHTSQIKGISELPNS